MHHKSIIYNKPIWPWNSTVRNRP